MCSSTTRATRNIRTTAFNRIRAGEKLSFAPYIPYIYMYVMFNIIIYDIIYRYTETHFIRVIKNVL